MEYSKISSPCYVLEEVKLIQNLELIRSVQERAGVAVILALKGFAMFSAFPIIQQYLSGTTASSLFEAMLAREEFGKELHLYLPVYQEQEFDALIQQAVHITFNSLSQWQQFKSRTLAAGVSPGLRINPEYSPVEHEIYNPASPSSRLGIRAAVLGDHSSNGEADPNGNGEANRLPEGIEGLHCHNLCESDSCALAETLNQIEARFGQFLPQIKWLNLGGGHLMTREGYDVEHLIKVLTKFKSRYPHLMIYLEPGAAVVWEAGFLRATVLDLVETPDITIAMLDVSFTAHMPDSLEMPYKPKITGAVEPQPGKHLYRMGGITCLAGDVMGDYAFEKPLQVGDALLFEDMMHYTMVKTSMFNGIRHPSIGIIRKSGDFELVRSFTYEDYKSRMS
jgi:carboxynorspermidine decarboxylase